ncbi:HDOD domain-containing protein [Pinirhizobacter sp.]|jgi:HD-like signal output (HDOD) protein|uniref:HDOD domain-containing protein n=1 Tax=Pinirhizobacter sp. TaxID=2950432 RepID=UPI002F40E9E5
MINFFRRWFGGGAATSTIPLPVARGDEPAQWPEGTIPPWQASDLDLIFNRLALGVAPAEDDTLTANEQAALRHLRDQFNGDRFDPKSLPRLPSLVPQLLRSLRSDEVGSAALAAQIGKDPVLVGEIVRVCNSAMYRGSGTIDSLQQGVMLLGQDGLRRVVMQLVMRPILQLDTTPMGVTAGQAFWSHAERCAQATLLLGRGAVDSFEAYLAGTVCNTGAVAVVRMLDQRHYLEDNAHSARFIQAFAQLSRRVAVTTARHWAFPERVVQALTERAGHEGQQYSPLGRALRVADRLAMLDMLTDRKLAESDAVLSESDAHGYTPEQMLAVRGQLQRAFATDHSVSA